MNFKIFHIADLHLGRTFQNLPEAQDTLSDRIAVWMFLSVDHHVQFDYSKRKWSVASKLLPETARSNVENFLKNVKKQVEVESSTPEPDSSQKKYLIFPNSPRIILNT